MKILLLALVFLPSFAIAQSDTTLRYQKITGQEIGLFSGVLDFLETIKNRSGEWRNTSSKCIHQAQSSDPFICQDIESPLSRYSRLPAPKIDEKQMSSVEGLLETIFIVAHKVQWPTGLMSDSFRRRLEEVVLKVEFETLEKRLDTALGTVQTESARRELEVSRAYMIDLKKKSLKQAQLDSRKFAETGLKRDELPYPLLSESDRRFLSMVIGGAMWRFRGAGGYDDMGTKARRKYFARKPFETLARLNGANSFADEAGWAVWLGLMQSWGRYHDLGRLNDSLESDFIEMGNRGRFITRPTKQLLKWKGYDASAVGLIGTQTASCYYYGWEAIDKDLVIGAELKKPFLFIIGAPSNFGELCTGAVLGLGLSQTWLKGRR